MALKEEEDAQHEADKSGLKMEDIPWDREVTSFMDGAAARA
jgi:hypothetical protein